MPARRLRGGFELTMLLPLKRMSPAQTRTSPKMDFRTVDLPAPFGPINAKISPGASEKETP